MSTLQELYNSELNFELRCVWDAGFEWALGDALNGYHAHGQAGTVEAAVEALAKAACKYFPLSKFAQERRLVA